MTPVVVDSRDADFPGQLRDCLGAEAPGQVVAQGDLAILQRTKIALFCSVRCPGSAIVQSYDLTHRLREAGLAVAGGFHSPMEQEWLKVLLRGPSPVILCPARRLGVGRVPLAYRKPLDEGRLLILSPFGEDERRATAEAAVFRNRFVAALADRVFVAYAEPGGKTDGLWREALGWGKPLYTFAENAGIVQSGARIVRNGDVPGGAAYEGGGAGDLLLREERYPLWASRSYS